MRSVVFLAALAFVGCASAPPEAAAPVKTTYVTASSKPVEQVNDPNMTAQRLADAKRLGFKVINENGESLYCRTAMSTGSRIVRDSDTKCYTLEQWEAIRQQSEEAMQQWHSSSQKSGN